MGRVIPNLEVLWVSTLPTPASAYPGQFRRTTSGLFWSNGTDWVALPGAGDTAWTIVDEGQTFAAGDALVAVITADEDFLLPAVIATGQRFTVHNSRGSADDVLVRVVVGSGRQINGLDAEDDLTCAPGETIDLVAVSATNLDLITPGAIGPIGPPGPPGAGGDPVASFASSMIWSSGT